METMDVTEADVSSIIVAWRPPLEDSDSSLQCHHREATKLDSTLSGTSAVEDAKNRWIQAIVND
jgi:hypothetical protein